MESSSHFLQKYFKSGGLRPISSGDVLHHGRYEIRFPHSYASVRPHDGGHMTYVAKDTQTSKFVCLRIFGATTSTSDPVTHGQEALKDISSEEASDRLLVPTDNFWLEGPNGKHLALAYELFGPDLGYLKENGPSDDIFPVNVVQKVIVDALEAVNFVHRQGLCHGAIGSSSLLLTYPDLDSRDESQLALLFRQPAQSKFSHPEELGYFAIDSQNETATGSSGASNNVNFKIKLQDFSKAFPAKDSPRAMRPYIHESLCPPPELAFNEPISTATDIWYLALTLAVLTSPFPRPGPLELDSIHDPRLDILDLRDILGDLPAHYKSQLENPKSADVDLEYDPNELRDILLGKRLHGTPADIDMKGKVWKEEDMDAWVVLLKGMLRWVPGERSSAEDVLDSELVRKFK